MGRSVNGVFVCAEAVDIHDIGQVVEAGDYRRDMLGVGGIEGDLHQSRVVRERSRADRLDKCLGFAEEFADIFEQAKAVAERALAAAREAAPQVPRAWLTASLPPDWEVRARALDAVAIHTDHTRLTAARAAQVKAAGFGLFCYTVNAPARARELFGWGVDGLCTDRIDLIPPDFA